VSSGSRRRPTLPEGDLARLLDYHPETLEVARAERQAHAELLCVG
jgi:hypothetical protein